MLFHPWRNTWGKLWEELSLLLVIRQLVLFADYNLFCVGAINWFSLSFLFFSFLDFTVFRENQYIWVKIKHTCETFDSESKILSHHFFFFFYIWSKFNKLFHFLACKSILQNGLGITLYFQFCIFQFCSDLWKVRYFPKLFRFLTKYYRTITVTLM